MDTEREDKEIQSIISSPNLSTKIDFYGVKGLKIGLAGYFEGHKLQL